jgi:hypothetical protein
MDSTTKPSEELKDPKEVKVTNGKRKKRNIRLGLRIQDKELDT